MAIIGQRIKDALHFLQNDVIGIPTETVYGLAGNAYRPDLVARIFDVKQRPTFDPLIVHAASHERAMEFAGPIPDDLKILATQFWPGPLTLLLPKKTIIPDLVTSGLPNVAVRIPNHPLTQQLLQELDFPLAAPSANPFGYVSPTTANHVNDQLGNKIPFVLDGGPCQVGVESTIVGIEQNRVCVFRLGGIALEEIEGLVGKVILKSHSSNPLAPGMLDSHYAPGKRLLLGDIETLLDLHRDQSPFVISFTRKFDDYPPELQFQLSRHANVNEAAMNLFSALRFADSKASTLILAETVPEIGLGRAVNDRLRRAAF